VQVVGIDLSEQMLKLARAARPKGDYFTHDFHYPLPSDKGPFDIIFASSAFDLCNDLGEVLSAMAAALNEQGLFCFTIAEHRLVTPNNSEYERSARPGRSEPIWLHFFSFQEVSAALAQAGLYPVSYQYAEGYRSRSLNSSFDYGYWIAVKGQESRDLENATIQICNPTT
jgi:SAM-dependent methyltransferase